MITYSRGHRWVAGVSHWLRHKRREDQAGTRDSTWSREVLLSCTDLYQQTHLRFSSSKPSIKKSEENTQNKPINERTPIVQDAKALILLGGTEVRQGFWGHRGCCVPRSPNTVAVSPHILGLPGVFKESHAQNTWSLKRTRAET